MVHLTIVPKYILPLLLCLSMLFGVNQATAASIVNPAGKTIANTTGGPAMQGDSKSQQVTNNGNIVVSGLNPFDAVRGMDATAEFDQSTNSAFILTNTGTLTMNANILSKSLIGVTLTGIRAYKGGDTKDGHQIINSGSVDLTLKVRNDDIARATGLDIYSNMQKGHLAKNSGSVKVHATGGAAYATGVTVGNDAFLSSNIGNHLLQNVQGGLIDVQATALEQSIGKAYGMFVGSHGNHTFNNSGTVNVKTDSKGSAASYGLMASVDIAGSPDGNGSVTFNNYKNATLKVIAQGALGDNIAVGMYVDLYGTHTLSNAGTMTISSISTATNNDTIASGMYAEVRSQVSGNLSMTNSGNMTVTAQNKNSEYVFARGFNVGARASSLHTLINTGTMTINANGLGYVEAYGVDTGNNAAKTQNAGTIKVTASGGDNILAVGLSGTDIGNKDNAIITVSANASKGEATAYGFLVQDNGTVNNFGTINVTATGTSKKSYEVYGNNSYTVGTWATTLRDFSKHKVFGGGSFDAITFDNSTLILRPGTKEQGFVLGKEYAVKDMVEYQSSFISSLGAIASVSSETPLFTAQLSGTSIDNQTVSLEENISEDTSPGHQLASQLLQAKQARMSNVSAKLGQRLRTALFIEKGHKELGGGSSLLPDFDDRDNSQWTAFLVPHGNTVSNTESDFHGNTIGLFGGITRHFTEKFSLGVHLDLSSSRLYGDYMDIDSDSLTFSAGVHAAYMFSPEWYVRAHITAAFDDNDIKLSLHEESSLSASTSYASSAIFADITTGYIFKINENHAIIPEIGLSWLHIYSQGYDLLWQDPAYNMFYDATTYAALYGTAMLHYNGYFPLDDSNGRIKISAGLGVRHNFSGAKLESHLRFSGEDFTTQSTEDITSVLATAGIEWKKDNFSVSLNYNGSYGATQNSHGGMVQFRLDF